VRTPVGQRTSENTKRNRHRSVGGSWSYAIAEEMLHAHGLLSGNLDPSRFSHREVAAIIQRLDRENLPCPASEVRCDIEWILWDRDGWRHVGEDRHERRAA